MKKLIDRFTSTLVRIAVAGALIAGLSLVGASFGTKSAAAQGLPGEVIVTNNGVYCLQACYPPMVCCCSRDCPQYV